MMFSSSMKLFWGKITSNLREILQCGSIHINRCAFIYEKVFYADVQTLANTFQRVQGWILNAALNMPNVCGIHVTT